MDINLHFYIQILVFVLHIKSINCIDDSIKAAKIKHGYFVVQATDL